MALQLSNLTLRLSCSSQPANLNVCEAEAYQALTEITQVFHRMRCRAVSRIAYCCAGKLIDKRVLRVQVATSKNATLSKHYVRNVVHRGY
jgi:hypothetical protein